MAINEPLTQRVRSALAHRKDVVEKKMFTGITFMVDDKMCISVGNDRLMLRIDPALHEEAVQKPGCRPVLMRGREYKGFVYVQEDAVKSKKDFDNWVELALDYNARAISSKKKKKKG
jgi:TfoX/Sxy family transcriptional regulator of competence genes